VGKNQKRQKRREQKRREQQAGEKRVARLNDVDSQVPLIHRLEKLVVVFLAQSDKTEQVSLGHARLDVPG
jgi:hypothetical protein